MDRPHLSLLKPEKPAKLQKLLDAAQHYPCAHCNRQDGTVVAAHNNELAFGRGAFFKTSNHLVAYLCHECHDGHEGRRGNLTREQRRELWHRAHTVTVAWWWRDGLIVVV